MFLGALSPTEIDDLLRAETVARLACQEAGQPYVVPLNYACDGDAIVVHSLEGRKIDIMRANPSVCVEVDQIEGMTSWRTVVASGRFEELRGDEAARALATLVTRLQPPGAGVKADPFAPPGLEDRVVLFRVRLLSREGRYAHP